MTITINSINEEKITATPSVLNFISILADAAQAHYEKKEYYGLADEAAAVSLKIYEALKESGFYKK